MILFQTDGENEVLKLDKLWHATRLLDTTFDLFSVWKEEGNSDSHPLRYPTLIDSRGYFLLFYLAFCSALQQLSVSTAWKPQTIKPAQAQILRLYFSPSQTCFSVHLFSLSAVCLQVSWIDTRWWWSVLHSGAFGWLCSSCDPLSAHRAFLKDKGLAARTLIHTVKLN